MVGLLSACATPMHVAKDSLIPFKVEENLEDSTLTIEVPVTVDDGLAESVYQAITRDDVWCDKNGVWIYASPNAFTEKKSAVCMSLKWQSLPKGEELIKISNTSYIWRKIIPNWISCKGKWSTKNCNNQLFLSIKPPVGMEAVCKGPIIRYDESWSGWGTSNVVDAVAYRLASDWYSSMWNYPLDLDFTSYTLRVQGNIDSPYTINCEKGRCVIEKNGKPWTRSTSESLGYTSIQWPLTGETHLNAKQIKQAHQIVRRANRTKENNFSKAEKKGHAAIKRAFSVETKKCIALGDIISQQNIHITLSSKELKKIVEKYSSPYCQNRIAERILILGIMKTERLRLLGY